MLQEAKATDHLLKHFPGVLVKRATLQLFRCPTLPESATASAMMTRMAFLNRQTLNNMLSTHLHISSEEEQEKKSKTFRFSAAFQSSSQ